MRMELIEEIKELFSRTAKALSGSARRIFMADVIAKIGWGGQRQVAKELKCNRGPFIKANTNCKVAFCAWTISPRVAGNLRSLTQMHV